MRTVGAAGGVRRTRGACVRFGNCSKQFGLMRRLRCIAQQTQSGLPSVTATSGGDPAEPMRLPHDGSSWERVEQQMDEASAGDSDWHGPRMFKGGSYFGRQDVVEVANAAYAKYINFNALYGGTIFPSLQQFDRDVVGMVLQLLNAPMGAGGSLTTGGTESILLSVKTAVHWARETKPDLAELEIIVPHSCHPGFDKAADMLGGVKVVRLSKSDSAYMADVVGMRAAISPATIMIVGSAPSYPFGVVDDIAAMEAMAREHDLWLHVDACNGGMVFPFAKQFGRSVRRYDFELPGVRSISVDIHKLGYSNKGVSALLLRHKEEERYHRFTFDNWPSGLYSTASIAGSRSGGGVASAWAVMRYLGNAGYVDIVRDIYSAVDAFVSGISAVPGMRVLGQPDAYLVAFESADPQIDILAVDAGMTERGWSGTQCVYPVAIHLFIDGSHSPAVATDYCKDLVAVVDLARKGLVAAPTTTHNVLGVYTRT